MNNNRIFEELIIFSIVCLFLIFPFIYILVKKGMNKFLFCSACTGAIALTFFLLYIVALPFGIVMVKAIPQLAEYGQVDYILPLLYVMELIHRYHFVVLLPLLNLLLPVLIYRRYSIFRRKHAS